MTRGPCDCGRCAPSPEGCSPRCPPTSRTVACRRSPCESAPSRRPRRCRGMARSAVRRGPRRLSRHSRRRPPRSGRKADGRSRLGAGCRARGWLRRSRCPCRRLPAHHARRVARRRGHPHPHAAALTHRPVAPEARPNAGLLRISVGLGTGPTSSRTSTTRRAARAAVAPTTPGSSRRYGDAVSDRQPDPVLLALSHVRSRSLGGPLEDGVREPLNFHPTASSGTCRSCGPWRGTAGTAPSSRPGRATAASRFAHHAGDALDPCYRGRPVQVDAQGLGVAIEARRFV